MIPELFPSHEPSTQFALWKIIIGVLIVLFASFVGVEIRIGNDDDEN
tara:strand:- start:172 stop:312 length:141 start_codon:yes stop_codon:yes gene_type:complete